jgi:hypothetical protein
MGCARRGYQNVEAQRHRRCQTPMTAGGHVFCHRHLSGMEAIKAGITGVRTYGALRAVGAKSAALFRIALRLSPFNAGL